MERKRRRVEEEVKGDLVHFRVYEGRECIYSDCVPWRHDLAVIGAREMAWAEAEGDEPRKFYL